MKSIVFKSPDEVGLDQQYWKWLQSCGSHTCVVKKHPFEYLIPEMATNRGDFAPNKAWESNVVSMRVDYEEA